jgi:hypothetical protein
MDCNAFRDIRLPTHVLTHITLLNTGCVRNCSWFQRTAGSHLLCYPISTLILIMSRLLPAHAGSSLADFSTLKMEAIRSSETSVHFTGSTRRHIPEDGILHSNRCENLKSHMVSSFHSRSGIPANFVLTIVGKNTPAKEIFIWLLFVSSSSFLCFVRKSYIIVRVITRRYVRKRKTILLKKALRW